MIARPDPNQPLSAERIGWVVDRGRMLRDGPELPARVATLDELAFIVRRDRGLRFDADLGFHLTVRTSASRRATSSADRSLTLTPGPFVIAAPYASNR